jgi:hypothetical protein
VTPDFHISLAFLERIYPDGPWMLTAISIDKKSIEARTFSVEEKEEVIAWLNLHKQKNLYYSVNQPIVEAYEKRKLSKTDVHSVHFIHVDVDPRVGEDVESEQNRIKEQLFNYKIEPTEVIFSGGGYNALWRLERPIPIADGSPSVEETIARAIDVERRNWQLELDFDTPDHCRDISRILRLPGTINRPNAEKIAKGRVPNLARIARVSATRYPLSAFMATQVVATNSSTGKAKVSENIQRVESLDHIKGIPEKLKVIIAQGFDPEDKKWDGDRSGVLYFVCCELVRASISDEVILGIITDSRYLISASVLDKGSGMMRYALRQVQRARDNADNPLLAEMNEKYAVILTYGNQTVVMIENARKNEQTQRYEPAFQNFRTFKDRIKRYPNIPIETKSGKTKSISAFEWWTSHPRRREFEDITFEPGLETPNRYNLWNGFACDAVQGDKHERYLAHIFDNICSGNQEHFDYLLRWMARVVQFPRTQSMVAPVLLGERGTGKSIFCNFFGAIFEPHRYTASDIQELTGKFNAHIGQCVFVVAEEAFDLRDKRHESVLKERITGTTTGIQRKGVDTIRLPNYIHLMMTSNNERVVPAGDKERRFFVLRVASNHIGDSPYWKAILKDQESGGLSNLLFHLRSIDLSTWDVTQVPRTDELREQQEHNLSVELDWLLEKLDSGVWIPGVKWEGPVRKKQLHEDYKAYLASMNARFVKGERAFHQFICRELPGTTDKQVYGRDPHDRPMVFIFPPLAQCREAFDRTRGWKSNWRKILADEEMEADVIQLPGKGVFE